MSENGTSAPPPADIPQSKGVSRSTLILALLAVAVIFLQGTLVVVASAFGRVWPWIDATKVPLH